MTLADVYYGRGRTILDRREKIKLQTLAGWLQLFYDTQAKKIKPDELKCLLIQAAVCPNHFDEVQLLRCAEVS